MGGGGEGYKGKDLTIYTWEGGQIRIPEVKIVMYIFVNIIFGKGGRGPVEK